MFGLFSKAPAYRPIGPERAFECAAIHAEGFAHPWSEAEFELLMLAASVVADGAIEVADDALSGFILSRLALDEAEILTIVVTPMRRGTGVGGTLLSTHIRGLAARGVTRLFLEVDTHNAAARALYGRCGFIEVGLREAYYRAGDAPPASAIVMRLDLPGQQVGAQDLSAKESGGQG